MKKIYRVEMMTSENYARMMGGYIDYTIVNTKIEAENLEEAIAIAKAEHPNMVVNENYVKTIEEIEKEEEARQKEIEEARQKEKERIAKAKATKEANERAKAEELEMTVEEYREHLKRERAIAREMKRVAELEKELARARKRLEQLRKG